MTSLEGGTFLLRVCIGYTYDDNVAKVEDNIETDTKRQRTVKTAIVDWASYERATTEIYCINLPVQHNTSGVKYQKKCLATIP